MTQNLVPNGSFECGEDYCEVFQIPQINEFNRYACEWSVPGEGTTDVFSTLTGESCYSHMPFNTHPYRLGAQAPRTGNRFVGIYTYIFRTNADTSSYREYIQVKLKKALVPGGQYCAEMYVSLADEVHFATNNLAMHFGNELLHVSNHRALGLQSTIIDRNIIRDTANWVRIGGDFVAENNAQYLIIGNMLGNSRTASEETYWFNQSRPYSYYYIDDVRVEKTPNDFFVTSGDTVLCQGVNVVLTAHSGIDEVIWTTLEDTTTVVHVGETFPLTAEVNTTFRVKSTGCNKTIVDTLNVSVNPSAKVTLGKDTVMCKGSALLLGAGSNHIAYTWQDNSHGENLEVTAAGRYWVEAINEFGCKERDEIQIEYDDVPLINLGRDTIVCNGFFPLHAGGNENSYRWSTGSVAKTLVPVEAGVYWLEARNHCGVSRDTIKLYKPDDLFIPNVVTANNDQKNDFFEIGVRRDDGYIDTSVTVDCSLQLFNRWGEVIYERYPYHRNWPLPDDHIASGIYYYNLSIPGCKNFKGWVHLIK